MLVTSPGWLGSILVTVIVFPAALVVAHLVADRRTAPDSIAAGTRPKRTFALTACVASFALVAAGCGGDDEPSTQTTAGASSSGSSSGSSSESSAEEWAGDLCSALTTWTNSLEEAVKPLADLSSLSEESLQQAADDAKTATATLAGSLKSLERPDTDSGDQVASSVENLATELETGANVIENAVAAVSSAADLPSAVETITTTVTGMGHEVDTAVQSIEDADATGELTIAFDDADACGDLTDSSSS